MARKVKPKPVSKNVGSQLGSKVRSRAIELIKMMTLNDYQIANNMTGEGLKISNTSVCSLRRSMGLPALYRGGSIPPSTIEEAERLIRKGTMGPKKIAKTMQERGYPISTSSVRNLREKMGINSSFTKSLEVRKWRQSQLASFRSVYKSLGVKEREARWIELVNTESRIKQRIASGVDGKAGRDVLLAELSEVALRLEALYSLLSEGTKRLHRLR